MQTAVGGCVPNVAHDLKRIDPELPVYAAGTVGADEECQLVKDTLGNAGVDVSGLVELPEERTINAGDISEMDEIGYEDYVYGEGVSLIEWANLIEEILPDERICITIEKDLVPH